MLNKLIEINRARDLEFPNGKDPFKMVTRLAEETGELAEQVNEFENQGVKQLKHGDPDKISLAKEVVDVMGCAIQVAQHYDCIDEVLTRIEEVHIKLHNKGLIR